MAFNSNNTDGNGEAVRQDGRPCVLVVDDNEMVAHALANLLSSEGWRVSLCYNGLDALKQVECEMLAAAVIDIHLPDFSGLCCRRSCGSNMGRIADHRAQWRYVDGKYPVIGARGGDVFHQQAD